VKRDPAFFCLSQGAADYADSLRIAQKGLRETSGNSRARANARHSDVARVPGLAVRFHAAMSIWITVGRVVVAGCVAIEREITAGRVETTII
jgi:hypothetical protein